MLGSNLDLPSVTRLRMLFDSAAIERDVDQFLENGVPNLTSQ
jgi:hypothetical protein